MKQEKSCGAIILRKQNKTIETLLVKHTKGHWAFAKGHVEENETEEETALREIKEETGLNNLKVVATGGLGRIIAEATDCIDFYDANLTLKGIYLVYKKQNRNVN